MKYLLLFCFIYLPNVNMLCQYNSEIRVELNSFFSQERLERSIEFETNLVDFDSPMTSSSSLNYRTSIEFLKKSKQSKRNRYFALGLLYQNLNNQASRNVLIDSINFRVSSQFVESSIGLTVGVTSNYKIFDSNLTLSYGFRGAFELNGFYNKIKSTVQAYDLNDNFLNSIERTENLPLNYRYRIYIISSFKYRIMKFLDIGIGFRTGILYSVGKANFTSETVNKDKNGNITMSEPLKSQVATKLLSSEFSPLLEVLYHF